MSFDIEDAPEQTTSSLVSGIFGDLKHLVEQQFQLTRQEIEEGLRQRAVAAAVIGLGGGILFLAAVGLCLSLSHLLHWASSPLGTDPAWLPLWACHSIGAAVLAVSGVTVARVGRRKFKSIDPPQSFATDILQEHSDD